MQSSNQRTRRLELRVAVREEGMSAASEHERERTDRQRTRIAARGKQGENNRVVVVDGGHGERSFFAALLEILEHGHRYVGA